MVTRSKSRRGVLVPSAPATGRTAPTDSPETNTLVTANAFAALRSRGYRTYLLGQSLANTGTWMQTIAQDWLVLRLTHSALAVGVVMALQFLPTLLLGVYGGHLADRYPKRRILLLTQTVNAVLTALLAVLTVTGAVRPAHVYVFALLAGLVFVVDAPTRQVFMAEVVPPGLLRGAISLNAAVFQTTRLVGPALAGLLIGAAGTGWVFAVNALCYAGPTVGLLRLRPRDLTPVQPAAPEPHALRATGRYVLQRPHVAWTILLVGIVGTFGLNFPIVLTAMASGTFGGDAGTYAVFNIALAIGSVAGALLAGSRPHTRLRLIVLAAAVFGLCQVAAAAAPGIPVFLALLVLMGLANLAFQAMANSSVQLWVDPVLRGRIMGLYMLVFTGGTPIGAPVIGAITSHFGPRTGMTICGALPALAAATLVLLRPRPGRPVTRRRCDVSAVDPESGTGPVEARRYQHGEGDRCAEHVAGRLPRRPERRWRAAAGRGRHAVVRLVLRRRHPGPAVQGGRAAPRRRLPRRHAPEIPRRQVTSAGQPEKTASASASDGTASTFSAMNASRPG
jgi:MFS family permease